MLRIRIKKLSDGNAALTCVRADGSTTWQRQMGLSGGFFPLHDLTHYAVETVLGVNGAFFGLVASGWEINDFAPPWPRGPLPSIALDIELIVGFLDSERASGVTWSAADLRDKGEIYYALHKRTVPPDAYSMTITDSALEAVRAKRGALFATWRDVAVGETLELEFE